MKNWSFPLILILSIFAGGLTGYLMGKDAVILKPLGDIFLNLLFVAVVPLIFFAISSAVAHLGNAKKLLNVIISMFAVFIFTGIIASIYMLVVVKLFPPAQGFMLKPESLANIEPVNIANQIVSMISVADFTQLFSHKNIMPLIIFSLLVGLATASAGENGKAFASFLKSGTEVFMKVITYIMYYAPIGFFAYFAVLTGDIGPKLISTYFRIIIIYYSSATIYFILAFTFYAWLGGGANKIKLFWKNVFVPMLTAFATCSSAASIPANLQATRNMKVNNDIVETVIPLGAILHKDGSVLGAIVKISFLFGIYGMNFSSPTIILTAILVALLVGTVMGAFPSGGMLGEMLILSFYGFPVEALLVIAAISLLIDPLATMLNVTGDSVSAMMVERLTKRKIQDG